MKVRVNLSPLSYYVVIRRTQYRQMPKVATVMPGEEIKIAFTSFPDFAISYPKKRVYTYGDLVELAGLHGYVGIHELPATTLDGWVKSSGITKKRVRTTVYTENDLFWFSLYCLCRSTYKNPTIARNYFNTLST